MLSYQHGYHAGNFADVVKHLTLSRLLAHLTEKEKPLFYLETHAGRGLYSLKNPQALKTAEFRQGIQLLWNQREQAPAVFASYLSLVNQLNSAKDLDYYPGSPYLAIHTLRQQDRIYCCELHPREFDELEQLSHQRKRVHYSNSDGIIQLKALLPPPERRGLIFIDPSYEIKTDYKELPKAIKSGLERFGTGVFCLWYPIVDKYSHEQLERGMQTINGKEALRIEFNLNKAYSGGMSGCGLWIVNPPYKLAIEMKIALDYLRTIFNSKVSSFLIETVEN